MGVAIVLKRVTIALKRVTIALNDLALALTFRSGKGKNPSTAKWL
jgi:hypothetical protein